MKTIGIIGGISWLSSMEYYRLMNEMVRERLGGLNSAEILMYSIAFGPFSEQERLGERANWKQLVEVMIDSARRLKSGGAKFIVIASNTMNSTAHLIEAAVSLPVLHIADSTGKKIREKGFKRLALLGTEYTMAHHFYRERLEHRFGLKIVTPNKSEREYINNVIFDELCVGKFVDECREKFVKIINRLAMEKEAEAVILGCTEIPFLIKPCDVNVPVFNTAEIHSEAAVEFSLNTD